MIHGIVTYLWLTHPTNSNKPPKWLSCKTPLRQCICSIIGKHIPERIDFLYVPCKGLNETEIKKRLSQIQDKRLNGIETRMVFLGDINCDSRNNVLNMLVGMVEDGFIRKRNIVISMDNLPAEFRDQFEPIYLEPAKQDILASTPKDTPENQAQSTKQNNKPIYYKKTGTLSYDGKDTQLKGQRKKIFEAIALERLSKKQEIFNCAFKPNKMYRINAELNPRDKNKFNSELSELKSQCFDNIGIKNIIKKEEPESDYYILNVVIQIK